MTKQQQYQQLEAELVTYRDLIGVPVAENGEAFVTLPMTAPAVFGVVGRYETLTDMQDAFPLVPVRQTVKQKLDLVDQAIKEFDPNLQLVVAYGYRSLETQRRYFEAQKQLVVQEQPELTNDALNEVVHRLIAVPGVAGHPTGGAVDVYIENAQTGEKLDFGVPIFTFDSKDVYTFSPFISAEAKKNRQLLRQAMMGQGFAPYDGEWWHYSVGDKEWACYYQQPTAVFGQQKQSFVRDQLTQMTAVSSQYRTMAAAHFYFQ